MTAERIVSGGQNPVKFIKVAGMLIQIMGRHSRQPGHIHPPVGNRNPVILKSRLAGREKKKAEGEENNAQFHPGRSSALGCRYSGT
jgi:hypothetical protein